MAYPQRVDFGAEPPAGEAATLLRGRLGGQLGMGGVGLAERRQHHRGLAVGRHRVAEPGVEVEQVTADADLREDDRLHVALAVVAMTGAAREYFDAAAPHL